MKKNNIKSNLFLFIAVGVIWGAIGMKVVPHFIDDSPEVVIEEIGQLNDDSLFNNEIVADTSVIEFSYVNINRDPFMLKKKRIVKTVKKMEPKVLPKVENIDFVINGVIMRKDKKLVILQDKTNNNIMFLREGDHYKNLKINSISPSTISLLQNNEVKKIKIQ